MQLAFLGQGKEVMLKHSPSILYVTGWCAGHRHAPGVERSTELSMVIRAMVLFSQKSGFLTAIVIPVLVWKT